MPVVVLNALTLADGSQVSSTDHHLFWLHDQSLWSEAEDLAPQDWLLTPDGPAEIARVDIAPSNATEVWELTVDIDHTFTVAAGPHDVVVHNQDLRGVSPADLDANWQAHQVSGGTAATWFDSLTQGQVDAIRDLPGSDIRRRRLASGLRNGGGKHEFFPVSMASEAKRLGLTAADIHSFTIDTLDFVGIEPGTDIVFNHKSSRLSRLYHEALYEAIRGSESAQQALDNIRGVNQAWQVKSLTGAGDFYTENQLLKRIDQGLETQASAQQIRDNYKIAYDAEAIDLQQSGLDWSDRTYNPSPPLGC